VRFVVTNVALATMAAQAIYEQGYCPRGDMENLSSSYPYRELFEQVASNLRRRAAALSGAGTGSPSLASA
jgi:hypothetical protein